MTRLRPWPLAASTSAAALLLALLWFPSLIGARWYSDEGVFAAVAQSWRDGGTLYADAWDNKPPLIFATYAAGQALFGDSLVSVRALAMLFAMGAVGLAVIIGTRLYGHARGAVAGIVTATALGTPVFEGNLALTEVFMIVPAAAGMLVTMIAVDRRDGTDARVSIAAGICFGLAMGYKQVALFDLAAASLLILLLHPRPARMLAWLAAAAAIPQVAFLLFFVATGAGGEYLYAIVGSMAPYAAAVEDPKPAWSTVLGYAPAAVALMYVVAARWSFDVRAFPTIWFALAFASAASSPYAFPHYLVQAAVPFALVAAGMHVPSPGRLRIPRSGFDALAHTALVLATAAAAVAVFGPEIRDRQQSSPRWYYATSLLYLRGQISHAEYEGRMDGSAYSMHAITLEIQHDERGETLFQWASFPWLYSATALRNPTPFATPWLAEWVPGARARIIDDLQADPPAYIVTSTSVEPFPALDWITTRDYELIRAQDDWQLYGLID